MEQKDLDKLNEIAKQLIGIEKDIVTKKGDKAQLEREVKILANSLQTEKEQFDIVKKKYQSEISYLEGLVNKLKSEQSNLESALKSKAQGLDNREVGIRQSEGNLRSRVQIVTDRENVCSKIEQGLKEKLVVISKITELAKGL